MDASINTRYQPQSENTEIVNRRQSYLQLLLWGCMVLQLISSAAPGGNQLPWITASEVPPGLLQYLPNAVFLQGEADCDEKVCECTSRCMECACPNGNCQYSPGCREEYTQCLTTKVIDEQKYADVSVGLWNQVCVDAKFNIPDSDDDSAYGTYSSCMWLSGFSLGNCPEPVSKYVYDFTEQSCSMVSSLLFSAQIFIGLATATIACVASAPSFFACTRCVPKWTSRPEHVNHIVFYSSACYSLFALIGLCLFGAFIGVTKVSLDDYQHFGQPRNASMQGAISNYCCDGINWSDGTCDAITYDIKSIEASVGGGFMLNIVALIVGILATVLARTIRNDTRVEDRKPEDCRMIIQDISNIADIRIAQQTRERQILHPTYE